MTSSMPTARDSLGPVQPRPVLSRELRHLLALILFLFGLLAVNSLYLVSVTAAERLAGATLENYFYLLMFLAHLALGLALVLPALVFGALHLSRAWMRPNRYAGVRRQVEARRPPVLEEPLDRHLEHTGFQHCAYVDQPGHARRVGGCRRPDVDVDFSQLMSHEALSCSLRLGRESPPVRLLRPTHHPDRPAVSRTILW